MSEEAISSLRAIGIGWHKLLYTEHICWKLKSGPLQE